MVKGLHWRKRKARPPQVIDAPVVHAPAAAAFDNDLVSDKVLEGVVELQGENVDFEMCGNTMNAMDLELANVLPGFTRRDEGGVVRIAELQSQGYLYIRP
jgi:intracellular sulfur oxidation DsrE/DsrF family protein